MKTPIQSIDGYYFKRDDLFMVGSANGSKARIMLKLAEGAKGLVACGDRVSTQIPRAAEVAKYLNLPIHIHTSSGEWSNGMKKAKELGAEIIQHNPGYATVYKKRARDDAQAMGYINIPWALECEESVIQNAAQIKDERIPPAVRRIVVVVGSGMTLAGLLNGMLQSGKKIPVAGVQIGGDVEDRLDSYAPSTWRSMVKLERSTLDYHTVAPNEWHNFKSIPLDPLYEAKCVPFLKPFDLLWIVGHR